MRFHRSTSLSWLALALVAALASTTASAAPKVVPTATPLTEEELIGRLSGLPCGLGVTNPPVASLDYILPPDDQFYTLIQPGMCPECGGTDSARLSNAHVVLNVLSLCTMPIEYSIVAADTGCTEPNTAIVYCSPIAANLVPATLGLVDFTLPLPDSCQFTGSAFLAIVFKSFPPGCDTQPTRPRLVLASGGCPFCRSYNWFETLKDDLCKDPDALPGQPVFYVDAWSCYTPTLAKTWGALKILYR